MSFLGFRARAPKRKKKKATAVLGSTFRCQSGLLFEALESRNLLTVTLSPIVGPDVNSAFDVPAGKDLYVPLTATDPGQTITYSVTSSDPSLVTTVFTENPTLQISVEGVDNDGISFSGTMTVELFENLAPDTVATISDLVNSGFYDGLSFYRIVPDFVIQGGANGTVSVDTFADEFDASLTFNSPGLLAMANPGTPDSNTSEFFITDTDEPLADTPQYLNFRHTIFGQLTSGFDLYADIMNAMGVSESNSSPLSPVTITSASIITDTQNGVVQIAGPNDFTGSSTITVTAFSTDGSSDVQSFVVNMVTPEAGDNHPLVLAAVTDLTTTPGTPITFELSASSSFGETPTFSITDALTFDGVPANVTVDVTQLTATTASVTLTPAADFTGTISLVARADDSIYDAHDAQAFTLTVEAVATIASVSDPINLSNVASTFASGTGIVGATISVVASDGVTSTSAQTTTVGSDGTWTISGIDVSALADGVITYTATDTSSAEDGASITATKDTQAPLVDVTDVTDPINLATSVSLSASGTGEVGATVSVVASDGENLSEPRTTTVGSDGTWSVNGINVTALNDGTIVYVATATDAAGNTAEDSQTATKDVVAPTVEITSVTDPVTIANVTNTTASGTGEVDATISLTASDGTNTTIEYVTTVGADGTWSITGIDVSALDDGTIAYVVTVSDAAGNSIVTSLTASKRAIAITLVTDPINAANAGDTSASGTGEVGATVSVVASDGNSSTSEYITTIGEDGTWSITGIDLLALADGEITFTATATDGEDNMAQNSKIATKDTVAPLVSISSVTDPINLTNAGETMALGTSEAGATISIVASDGTNSTTALVTTVGSDDSWSISGIDVSAMADGTITYTVVATDPAGNSAETTITAIKDTVAPDVEITFATDPIDIANSSFITASGTGEIGATISVVVTDGVNSTVAVTTIVAEDGTWSVSGIDVSPLADGTISYTATATDAAGNTAEDSITATKATVSVTLVTDPITNANAANISASGTGQVGATVSLVASDGVNTTTTFTTTIASDGTWSIIGVDVSALNDGTITFTATASDGEGNSAQASLTATKDTVAPDVAVTTVTNPIDVSNATNTTASGTGEVGATISVVASDGTNSTPAFTTTVASDGTWSITGIDVSSLNDGTITYTATATDATGNTAQASLSATKNLAATGSLSGFVYVDMNGNNTHDGTESVLAGAILTLNGVDLNSNPVPSQTTITAADGSYSFANLPAGTYSITQAQPAKLLDGATVAGSAGGSAGSNVISGIVLSTGVNATDYNFTERGLHPSMISLRLFLASTPPAQQIFNDTVAQYGIAAPVVMSIAKSDADPTTATSVSYTVVFNESVTGVDASDFTLGGISDAFIESVTGSGNTYTVIVNTGSGGNNLALSLIDDDSITSLSGTPLGGAGAGNGDFVGPSYTLSVGELAVTITSVTDPINAENVTSVTASGTSESGASISLAISDGLNTTTVSTTVQSDGTWSISGIDLSSFNDGQITFTATATNSANDSAQASLTATKDTVAPSVAVNSVTDPINADNASTVTASGTGEVGATISLVASDGSNTTIAYTTSVATDESWSISGIDVGALLDGSITFTATATDAAGNTAQSSLTATKDSQAPQVAITEVTDPLTIANHKNAEVSGTGEIGATVSLVANDGSNSTSVYTTTVGEGGTWSISDIDTSNLADGTITFTATASDSAGNTAQSSLTATKSTIAIVAATDPINSVSAANVTVSGTGEVGATVTLVATDGTDTTTDYTTTIGEDGTWTITGIDVSALADGTIIFTATASDSEGNTAQTSITALKDTVAPELAITSVTDPVNAENAVNATVSGTGEIGALITVVASDGGSSTIEYTTTVDEDGIWTVTGIDVSALNDGTITFTATASDTAGNVADIAVTAVKDTVPPVVDISTITSPVTIANHKNSQASGTGEVGATITLVADDGTNFTIEYTTTVGEDGTWSITGINLSPLADGTITFTIRATDAAGNSAETSATVTKTTVAVTSALNPINAENAANATVSGTGEVSATVTVVASDGVNSTIEYTTTIAEDGTWSITLIDLSGLADGEITYTIIATDGSENTAEVSHLVTKDTIAPEIVLGTVTDPINATNATAVVASGSGEAGATITVTATDGTNTTIEYTATIGEDGTWTITGIDVSGLTDGTITFTATATDAAGNSTQSSLTAIKDTVAPAVAVTGVNTPITIATEGSTEASGTGEIGAAITVVASDGNDTTIEYTTSVNEDGTWTITGIDVSGLADGTITYAATATDAAGNTAEDSLTTMKTTVAITAVTEPINEDSQTNVTVSGTGEIGAALTLVASDGTNSMADFTTTILEDGTWAVSGIDLTDLVDGTITFTATAEDSLGNTADATATAAKDTIAPEVAITSVTDPINAANAVDVTASGSGEAGATLSLVATDGINTTTEYTTTVGEDGTWTITGIDVSALADGTVTFNVTAADAAQNISQTSLAATKDSTAPIMEFASVTDPIAIANHHATEASGTGEVGATITVVATDGTNSTIEYTATISEAGTWSITGIDVSALADGTITFTATATDDGGNATESSLAATKTTVAVVSVTDPINVENASNVTIDGTGEVGATITVVATDGVNSTIEYTTTVGEGGSWSVTGIDVTSLGDGVTTFTVTAADAADNMAQTSATATKDTEAPQVTISGVSDPISSENVTDTAIDGTGEIGATITVVATDGANSTIEYTTTVGEDGTWDITGIDVGALADGTITFTATATDAAGNTGQSSTTATKEADAEVEALAQSDDSQPPSSTKLVDEALADEDYWL